MAINTSSLSAVIAEFRHLQAKDSISPEALGSILQRMADLIALADDTSEAVKDIDMLKSALESVASFLFFDGVVSVDMPEIPSSATRVPDKIFWNDVSEGFVACIYPVDNNQNGFSEAADPLYFPNWPQADAYGEPIAGGRRPGKDSLCVDRTSDQLFWYSARDRVLTSAGKSLELGVAQGQAFPGPEGKSLKDEQLLLSTRVDNLNGRVDVLGESAPMMFEIMSDSSVPAVIDTSTLYWATNIQKFIYVTKVYYSSSAGQLRVSNSVSVDYRVIDSSNFLQKLLVADTEIYRVSVNSSGGTVLSKCGTADEQRRKADELTRKNNESARVEAENIRVVNEQGRVEAESGRIDAELTRETAEGNRELAFRNAKQTIDETIYNITSLNNELVDIKSAFNRANVQMQGDISAQIKSFKDLIEFHASNCLQSVEECKRLVDGYETNLNYVFADIKKQEDARVAAEQERVTVFNRWEQSELLRLSQEETRVNNEQRRETAESAYREAEQLRSDIESARVDAEAERESAEAARANSESVRISAETKRKGQEVNRVKAETARVEAEAQRVEAEHARESRIAQLEESIALLQARIDELLDNA